MKYYFLATIIIKMKFIYVRNLLFKTTRIFSILTMTSILVIFLPVCAGYKYKILHDKKIIEKMTGNQSEITPETNIKNKNELSYYRIHKEMISKTIGVKSFYIDKYRISEFRRGQFFAFKNRNFLRGLNSSEAERICGSLGKRLCNALEWKKACGESNYVDEAEANYANCSKSSAESAVHLFECIDKAKMNDFSAPYMFDTEDKTYEWVKSDSQNRSMAMGVPAGREDINKCNSTVYLSGDYKSDDIGFRCCRDNPEGN